MTTRAIIQDAAFVHELPALARLVTFAHRSAKDLDIELPAYCLDVALKAILLEIQNTGVETKPSTASPKIDHFKEIH